MTLRIAVVGLGRIGIMHARNLAQTPGVDEVLLTGRNPEKIVRAHGEVSRMLDADAASSLRGALAPDETPAAVRTGGAFDDALGSVDGVVIATSTESHPHLTLQAARAGVPTLVEKPLTLDPERLDPLADDLETTGTEVMVAFHRRYDPAHRELRRRIAAGEAGTVRAVTATAHDHHRVAPDYIPGSGGIWHDMLIHDFDIIPWVTGHAVRDVWATGSVLDAPVHAEHGDVDTATAALTLDNGAVATVSGLRRSGRGQDVRLEVYGSLDAFATGIDERSPIMSTEPGVAAPADPYDDFADRFERAFRAEAQAFCDLVSGHGENLSPPRAGAPALRIARAAAESVRTGARIELT